MIQKCEYEAKRMNEEPQHGTHRDITRRDEGGSFKKILLFKTLLNVC